MGNNSSKHRTAFNQERFCELLLRQRNGTASLQELTELDDMVNNEPSIREHLLRLIAENNED